MRTSLPSMPSSAAPCSGSPGGRNALRALPGAGAISPSKEGGALLCLSRVWGRDEKSRNSRCSGDLCPCHGERPRPCASFLLLTWSHGRCRRTSQAHPPRQHDGTLSGVLTNTRRLGGPSELFKWSRHSDADGETGLPSSCLALSFFSFPERAERNGLERTLQKC